MSRTALPLPLSRHPFRTIALTTAAALVCTAAVAQAGTGATDAGSDDRERRALPVYYLGTFLGGEDEEPIVRYALYREFHNLRTGDKPRTWVSRSLRDMFENDPDDPDYYGLWADSAATLDVKLRPAKNKVILDLTGIAEPAEEASAEEAEDSLQQLVWTATAAASLDGNSYTKVVVEEDGERITDLWGAPADQPLTRYAYARSGIWILAPTDDEKVEDPVVVTGDAAFFENLGMWLLMDKDGVEIDSGTVSGTGGDTYRPYSIDLGTLGAGRYTIKVFDEGGLGLPGRGPVDTKDFRVVT